MSSNLRPESMQRIINFELANAFIEEQVKSWGIEAVGKEIFTIQGEYSAVCSLPDEKPVKSWVENGRTVIELPEITGFLPMLLKK